MIKRINILLLVLLFLAGCGKKGIDENITEVTFWHSMGGPLGEALKELIKEFNETHEDIHIKEIGMGNYTALSQKLMASVQADNNPDIAQVFESWTAGMIKEGKIVAISDFIAADPSFTDEDLDDVYDVYLESNTVNGKFWSFPFNKSVRCLYYNKDLFFQNDLDPNKPPKTWDEFRKVCEVLTKDKDKDGVPEIYGTTFSIAAWQFENLLLQAGGEIMSPDFLTPRFQEEPGVEALEFLNGLLKDKLAYLSTGYEGQSDFLAGKVGMVEGSSVSMAYMKRTGINFNMGIAAIPYQKTKRNIISGTNVCIFKNKDPETEQAAWEFVKWFSRPEQTARWSEKTYYMPVRKSAFEQPCLKKRLDENPEIADVFDQLNYASFEPPISQWYQVRKYLEEHVIEKVIRGILKPEEALEKAAEEMKKLIEKDKEDKNE
ncbi:MAG: ABC transporter substrate-binding protein [Candidatus Cloacimonadota bacterium]|nr:MAG: ABC transporter substrate-binding protein [Candidatus Cloacimonadota bacterium]